MLRLGDMRALSPRLAGAAAPAPSQGVSNAKLSGFRVMRATHPSVPEQVHVDFQADWDTPIEHNPEYRV